MVLDERNDTRSGDRTQSTSLAVQDVVVELAARQIVQGVSLHVAAGEIVGLVGPNGSGKSTLLRTIYRMIRPLAGRVLLNGDNVWKLSIRESARRTGVVVQEAPSDFEFTVREVVQMGRTPHKGMFDRETRDDEQIVTHALERVQMLPLAGRNYMTLSGGEKQRVLVARALAQQPQFLILDEPTNHLDIQHQLELLELIRDVRMTTLLTLHDLNLAALYCDRLYILSHGQIVASGTPEEALTPERIEQVFRVRALVGRHPTLGRLQLSFMPQSKAVRQQPIADPDS